MTTTTGTARPATLDRPVTVAAKTSGHACALIPRGLRFPVAWALDTSTGALTANGAIVGYVQEIVPGRLYAYNVPLERPRPTWQTSFSTAGAAAECAAVRYTVEQLARLWPSAAPLPSSPSPALKGQQP